MIHKVTLLTSQSKNDHFCTGLTAACLQDLIPRGKENGKLIFFCLWPAICLELEKTLPKKSKVHGQFKTIQRSRKGCKLFTVDGYRKVGIFSR